MDSFIVIVVICSSIWVFFDARKLGARKGLIKGFFDLTPVTWFFCCLLLWIIGFPAYLVKRSEILKAVNETTGTGKDEMAKQQITPLQYPISAKALDVKTCPFCAETIKKEAILCRFCNKDLAPKHPSEIKTEALLVTGNFEESGRQHFRNNKFQDAAEAFTKALELKKSGDLFYSRAVVYSKLRETDKMKADLFSAAELGNDKAKAAITKFYSS